MGVSVSESLDSLWGQIGDDDHGRAQIYELKYAAGWIRDNFDRIDAEIARARGRGFLWPGPNDFIPDPAEWQRFVEFAQPRRALEIGSGPCGAMATWWWLQNTTVIDPLVACYRAIQVEHHGRSWFDRVDATYAQAAEQPIADLVGAIDGFVMVENCLDHMADPYRVLENVASYAAPGCELLLWTDLWHGHADEGHFDMTKDPDEFEARIEGLGFRVLYRTPARRDDGSIEYGCRAVRQ